MQTLRQFNLVGSLVVCVYLWGSVLFAQTESVPSDICPNCGGNSGYWSVSYPISSYFSSQYFIVKTKSERDLVWGDIGGVIRNQPSDYALPIQRTTSDKVSISYTSSQSGTQTGKIQASIGVPKTGSIGGGYSESSTWNLGISGSSEHSVVTERTCPVSGAIWDRGYYYSKTEAGTRYRYNDNLLARFWCPACYAYTGEDRFTDIYAHEQATFIFPSGEAGIVALSGPWDTDIQATSYYTNPSSHYTDTNVGLLQYQPDTGGSTAGGNTG